MVVSIIEGPEDEPQGALILIMGATKIVNRDPQFWGNPGRSSPERFACLFAEESHYACDRIVQCKEVIARSSLWATFRAHHVKRHAQSVELGSGSVLKSSPAKTPKTQLRLLRFVHQLKHRSQEYHAGTDMRVSAIKTPCHA